ncbi:MAG TPA: hypothetical protein VFB58_12375 [Chloroflexota bacterium]|nr:hypothetical protein [Chloroflexota bacterium]
MRFFLLLTLVVALAGCSGSASSSPTPVPTRVASVRSTPTPHPTAIALDARYLAFVHRVCTDLAARNAAAVAALLMRYQYNSGLRWGLIGDGEGHTTSPSVLGTWLAHSRVRCISLTPDNVGHGAVLTSGWSLPSGSVVTQTAQPSWAIVEFDMIGGAWKINDWTFGSPTILQQAIHVNTPAVVPYRA